MKMFEVRTVLIFDPFKCRKEVRSYARHQPINHVIKCPSNILVDQNGFPVIGAFSDLNSDWSVLISISHKSKSTTSQFDFIF